MSFLRIPSFPRSPQVRIILFSLPLLLAGCARSADFKSGTPDEWRARLQPPLSDDQATSLAGGVALDDSVTLALERNPGVAAARQNWLAVIHTLPQATSLPDPMIEASVQLTEPMPLLERGWTFGLRQELPWWRKLWARGKVAASEADIARLRHEIAARDLLISVKDSYYELYYLDTATVITERIEQILRNEGLLAYGELQTGRTQISEAFRAESQAAQLAYDRLLLADQRVAEAERLRTLLNLPPETVIGPIRSAPAYPVTDDLPELFARAEQWAQVLRVSGLRVERAQYETYLARLERIPDISLGWMNEANVPAMMGETMRSALGGMNLPIWEQRNRAMIRERQAMEEAMRLEALGDLNMVREAVAAAWLEVRVTSRLVDLYRSELLPQAEAVMSQAEVLFRNDQASFANLIETTLAWHNFQLAHHRAVADHGRAIGKLERALGTTGEPRTSSISPAVVSSNESDARE